MIVCTVSHPVKIAPIRGWQPIGLGNNIRRRRKILGMTQRQLAEGIISVPYLSLIENEKALPGEDILKLLARRLNTDPETLMGIRDAKKAEQFRELVEQARTALNYEEHSSSEKTIQSLRDLASTVADPDMLVQIELLELNLLEHRSTPDQSEKLLEQFEERWKSALDRPAVKVPYLRIKGNIQYRKGHFEKALHHYLAAKQHLPEITDDIEKGYVYSNLGKTYVLLAHPSMGILYADKALEIMNRHDRLLEVCNLLHLKGTCLCHIGEYNEAILLFERIIRMCNQFLLCQLFASRAYHGMGICHMKRGNYPTAIRLFHQSIRVVSPNKLPEWEIGVVHQALGYTHLNAGNLKKAKRYVKSAMRRLKDRPNLYAECLVYLGMIHHAEGDLRRFEFCYRRAIDIFLSLGIHEKTARAAQTLGEFLSRADKPYQAVRYLKIAAEHYSKLVPTVDFDSELPGWDKNERQTSKTTQHRIV